MAFGVLGINHLLAPVPLRSALAEIAGRMFRSSKEASLILLSTCNRMEVYFSSDDLSKTHNTLLDLLKKECEWPFDQLLYTFFGKACLRHLMRVTAGIDSALFGETEIQGQVKRAYLESAAKYPLPFDLHYLFQKALQVGKKIRTRHLQLGSNAQLSNGVERTLDLFYPSGGEILLVGASLTNKQVALHLQRQGKFKLAISNRTSEKSERFAAQFNCKVVPWRKWSHYSAFVFGTSSPFPLLDQEDTFLKEKQPRLLIDLGVPQNVAPDLRSYPHLQIFDIDEIQLKANEKVKPISKLPLYFDRKIKERQRVEEEIFSSSEKLFHLLEAKKNLTNTTNV